MKIKELAEDLIDAEGKPLDSQKCLIELGHLLYLDSDKNILWACPIMRDDTLNRIPIDDDGSEEVELCWYPIEDEGFAEYSKSELKRINKFFKTNFK
jgi:hypothetical protein